MKLLDAINVVALMKERDCISALMTDIESNDKCGWSFLVNDRKYPIPSAVKAMFAEAVAKALDYYDSKIAEI